MSLTRIGFNFAAGVTAQNLNSNSRYLAKTQLALSSGKRINTVEDDASGFSLARGMEAERRGTKTAINNMANAENLLEIAMGAYHGISDLLLSLKERLMVAADGIYSSDQRQAIQKQIDAILFEIDDTVETMTFQGSKLVDGNYTGKNIQVGATAGQTFVVSLGGADTVDLGLTTVDATTDTSARDSMSQVDAALSQVTATMQRAGEFIMELNVKQRMAETNAINIEATRSRIEDTDFAREHSRMGKQSLAQQMSVISMTEAFVAPQQVLSLFT